MKTLNIQVTSKVLYYTLQKIMKYAFSFKPRNVQRKQLLELKLRISIIIIIQCYIRSKVLKIYRQFKEKKGINSKSWILQSQYFSMEIKKEPLFTIIHFNDVYDIQPDQKGLGGIVNFYDQIKKLRQKHKNNILLFSGDCFGPSSLSNYYKGQQMVKALYHLKIDSACYGNHQFDFGPGRCAQLSQKCNFKWLMGNIFDVKQKQRGAENINIGKGLEYQIISIAGKKLGIFGIASQEWRYIIGDEYALEYKNAGKHSNEMCKLLREKQCDIIIALTHMSKQYDLQLPTLCKDIDIILGGHDHDVQFSYVNNIPILKSGQNFKSISVVQVHKKSDAFKQTQSKKQNTNQKTFEHIYHRKGTKFDFMINTHSVGKALEQNQQLKNLVVQCLNNQKANDRILGYAQVDLDMQLLRKKETNYGNFIADLIKTYYHKKCDIVAINSGTVRVDIIPQGRIKYSDISKINNDQIGVRIVTGKNILKMLNNSVSYLPQQNGRFLFVSGITFTYDQKKEKEHRVQKVLVGSQPLDENKTYRLASRLYLFSGKDGYDMLKDAPGVFPPVQSKTILDILLYFFETGMQKNPLQRKASLAEKPTNNQPQLLKSVSIKMQQPKRQITPTFLRLKSMGKEWTDAVGTFYSICPKIDGRIKEII